MKIGVFPRVAWSALVLSGSWTLAQDQHGGISGALRFPSEEIPPLRIHVLAADGTSVRSIAIPRKATEYVIEALPPGEYRVMAYTDDPANTGSWTRFVTCGMKATCKDHSPIPVRVTAGRTTSGIDIADWYAPDGTFPSEPQAAGGDSDCSGRKSQLEEDACHLAAYEGADRRLNEAYGRIMAAWGPFPTCQEKLRDAQRAWIRFRDAQCAYEGAAGYKGRTTECLRELTEERVRRLGQPPPEDCRP